MKRLLTILLLLSSWVLAECRTDTTTIVTMKMHEEVAPALWRKTQKAFDFAKQNNADIIIIDMNTYGGMVIYADSIRTKILNSDIPVYAFINNNAASAGALISIACNKIFMKKGANIGAATVVNQTGEQMPDKYQSYMRSTMRSTAEAHGKDTIINGKDTIFRWKRNPQIAEAMVDASLKVTGVIDTGKVITFTTNEAIKYGFCEGIAENIQEIVEQEAWSPAVIKEYKPNNLDMLISWLLNPVFHSLLIMLMFGGIYFELQSPGIGFPLGIAILAAILYFAPLYLEGIANNWELALFFVGLILIGLEIFVIPGFGIAGISGLVLTVAGLTLAMVENFNFELQPAEFIISEIFYALFIITSSLFLSLILSLYFGKKIFHSSLFGSKISLNANQPTDEGFIGVNVQIAELVGQEGFADTTLRPSGIVMINGKNYDAKAEYGFIEKGQKIKITRYETGQVYVVPTENK